MFKGCLYTAQGSLTCEGKKQIERFQAPEQAQYESHVPEPFFQNVGGLTASVGTSGGVAKSSSLNVASAQMPKYTLNPTNNNNLGVMSSSYRRAVATGAQTATVTNYK